MLVKMLLFDLQTPPDVHQTVTRSLRSRRHWWVLIGREMLTLKLI